LDGGEQGGLAWVTIGADAVHAVADVAEGHICIGVGDAEATAGAVLAE
jgi:hypothetical protein